jgi:RNA polymerase sigma-70 factor (ECF subfamily)
VAQSALEKEVIARAQRGDREAFTEIYRSHSRRVFRHIYYLTRDTQESDDLTNETFLRVWRVIDKYEDRGLPIENWLLKIGHNLATRHLKRRRPTQDIETVSIEDSPDRLPEHLAEVASDAESVRAAVMQLPDLPRQVIIWRFLENMSYEEVGRIVRKSNGAIRVIQFRALKQLRGILEAMEASGPVTARDVSLSPRGPTTKEMATVAVYRNSADPLPAPLGP